MTTTITKIDPRDIDTLREQLVQLTYDTAAEYGVPVGQFSYRDVARAADIRSDMCVNAHGGKPRCIVGQWLARYGGVSVDRLENEVKGYGSDGAISVVLPDLRSTPVSRMLSDIQGYQDGNNPERTWLEAIQKGYQAADAHRSHRG